MAQQVNSYKELVDQGADNYFRQLLAIGWINEWHEDDISALQEALAETDNNYMVYCLSEYTFDPEGVCSAEKYKSVFMDIFYRFGINIEPENINAVEDGMDINITVSTDAGKATWKFMQSDTWAHDDIFDFINDELLPLVGEQKVLYPLPPSSTSLELVFAHPDTIDSAIEAGLIPDDYYFVA